MKTMAREESERKKENITLRQKNERRRKMKMPDSKCEENEMTLFDKNYDVTI